MEYSAIEKINQSLHAMEKTRWAISAFAALLADALAENADYKTHTIGIAALLERQIDDLSEIEEEISRSVNQIEIYLEGIHDGLSAKGISEDYASSSNAFEQTHLTLIAQKLKDGVKAGPIAQALNMKQTTVERVIAQLVPDEPDLIPIIDKAAVNG